MEARHRAARCATWVRATRRGCPQTRHIGAQWRDRTPINRLQGGCTTIVLTGRWGGVRVLAPLLRLHRAACRLLHQPHHHLASKRAEFLCRPPVNSLPRQRGRLFAHASRAIRCLACPPTPTLGTGVPSGYRALLFGFADRRPDFLAHGTVLAPPVGIAPTRICFGDRPASFGSEAMAG